MPFIVLEKLLKLVTQLEYFPDAVKFGLVAFKTHEVFSFLYNKKYNNVTIVRIFR